jgi:hypothetical protein
MKIKVGIKEVWEHTVEVEVPDGATDSEIFDAANDFIADSDEGEDEYDYTLDENKWVIYK